MPNNSNLKRMSLLAEIACDYYEKGLSQEEIAEQVCLSRTRVSRLLKEAVDVGIVEIKINYTLQRHYELEERLKARFPVKEVRVLNNRISDKDRLKTDIGYLAATYIMESLEKDMVIGTSWGTTLAEVMTHLTAAPFPVQVVQLVGCVYCRSTLHTPQGVLTEASNALGCTGNYLNLPLYIEDDYARQVICNDQNNRKILNMGMFSDMALCTISSIENITKREFWLGYMTEEMYTELLEKNAVGAIMSRFFDKNGQEIECKWNRKNVSVSFDQLKKIPNVVVVACDQNKSAAIHTALETGLIDTLIVDGSTASGILGLNPVHADWAVEDSILSPDPAFGKNNYFGSL